jgi:hypothetical protein
MRRAEEAPYAMECAKCGGTEEVLLRCKAGALCLDCAGLGHLEFLSAGSAALTRRAVKASRQPIVVMRMNMRRYRFERQGILAEPAAIEQAARESLNDVDVRGRDEIAAVIRDQFPGCPVDRAEAIALHTAARVRGRGRQRTTPREVGPDTVRLAVAASVLHVDTEYDGLLESGVDRKSARAQVNGRVESVLSAWRDGVAMLDT